MSHERPIFQDNETIRLTAEGVFLSNGEEIDHERTVEAFFRYLQRDSEGYFIQIGNNTKRIEVEDTPHFVRTIEWNQLEGANGEVEISLSDGTREKLDPTSLSYSPGRLICRVKSGTAEAKFLRKPYHELLMRCLQDGDKRSIRIGATTIQL